VSCLVCPVEQEAADTLEAPDSSGATAVSLASAGEHQATTRALEALGLVSNTEVVGMDSMLEEMAAAEPAGGDDDN
jgi:hypothetical protein